MSVLTTPDSEDERMRGQSRFKPPAIICVPKTAASTWAHTTPLESNSSTPTPARKSNTASSERKNDPNFMTIASPYSLA